MIALKRLDPATLAGLALAFACIAGGLVLEGGTLADIRQLSAAVIVLGCTLAAVLVTTPLEVFLGALRRAPRVFWNEKQPFDATLDRLVKISEHSRRLGVNSLEKDAAATDDAFFRKALNLAADGLEQRDIRETMRLEIEAERERMETEIRVWEDAGGYAPTIGIVGAVLGLIQVMKHLEHLDDVGRGIAVAFAATVYGVASANLLFLPAAAKLGARARELERLHEMMLEGVVCISEGINPRLMRIKLEAFLESAKPAPERRKPRLVKARREAS